jgi:hypothetical protein
MFFAGTKLDLRRFKTGVRHTCGSGQPVGGPEGLAEVADKDDVASVFALGQEQLRAVTRPGKIEQQAGGEIRDAPWRASRQGLFPDIRSSVSSKEELHALSIG